VPNEKGQMVEWSVEGGSPATLSRGGWKRSTFSPGDQVTIKVHPMRDGSAAGNFMGAKFADGRTVGNWDRAGGGSDY
jgi:hypothetical protein